MCLLYINYSNAVGKRKGGRKRRGKEGREKRVGGREERGSEGGWLPELINQIKICQASSLTSTTYKKFLPGHQSALLFHPQYLIVIE